MKIWIVSSLDEETIRGAETIQGMELYEEIRYALKESIKKDWCYEFFMQTDLP